MRVAHAQPEAIEARARVLLADGIEQSASPETLAKLGPELPAALLAIFERTSEARYVRLRALSMLSHFAQPRVMQLFVRLVHEGVSAVSTAGIDHPDALHPSRSALVLRRAIEGLARRSTQQSSVDLTRALSHANAQVRRAAVLALGEDNSVGVQRALSAQLSRETSPMVLAAIRDRFVRSKARPPTGPRNATPPR